MYVKDKLTKQILTQGSRLKDLYVLENLTFFSFYTARQVAASAEVWHRRLGHPSDQVLQRILSSLSLSFSKTDLTNLCHACQLGKHTRLPFSTSNSIVSNPFDIIHSYIWTSPVLSVNGFKYYLLFLDQYSHFVWIYPLH